MVSEERRSKARVAKLERGLKSRRLRSVSQVASATATLDLTTSAQDIEGCSLSLGAGTWLIVGVFAFSGNNQGAIARGYCNIGGTDESAEAQFQPNGTAGVERATVLQMWPRTLTATTVVKLRALKDADVGIFRAWITHTRIFAMRTGD